MASGESGGNESVEWKMSGESGGNEWLRLCPEKRRKKKGNWSIKG